MGSFVRTSVISNWSAIDDLPQTDGNAWAVRNIPSTAKGRVLYSGTMGLKHNPQLLVDVAKRLPCEVAVIGSGSGYDQLRENALTNLHLLPLQPFEYMPEVLGSGDVLVAVIEREAGEFSVPSKILSYLCAGRPIVLAAPRKPQFNYHQCGCWPGSRARGPQWVCTVREILGNSELANKWVLPRGVMPRSSLKLKMS